ILQPNDLTHTFNYGEHPVSSIVAHPWSMNITGTSLTDLTTTPYLNQLFSLATTAGGLMTTAEENVHFWNKLFTGQILSSDSWNEMITTKKLTNGTEYGLGIFKMNNPNGKLVYSHGGTFFGFLTENMVDINSGVCISVLTNQDSVNNTGIAHLYVAALHKATLELTLGIPANTSLTDVVVYPNPANNFITVKHNLMDEDLTMEIYDLAGKMIPTTTSEIQNNRLNTSE